MTQRSSYILDFLSNANHVGGYNEHLYGERGHRGSYTNATTGRLIDRQAMIDTTLEGDVKNDEVPS